MPSPQSAFDTDEQGQQVQQDPDKQELAAYRAVFGSLSNLNNVTDSENELIRQREQPQATYQRPKLSRGRQVIGNILASTRGGYGVGERLLYQPEREAREDFDLASQNRKNTENNQALNTVTRARQYERSISEPRRLETHQAALGKIASDTNLNVARTITEGSRQKLNIALGKKALEPEAGTSRPGSMIFEKRGANAGKVLQQGDPGMYDRSGGSRTSVFGTFSPGQGLYKGDKAKGTLDVVREPDPAAARASHPAPGAAALSGKGLQVEQNKSKALLGQKASYDKRRDQINERWRGFDVTSPTRPDGTPNPYRGSQERELDELNKWDSQKKNLIERSYHNELGRIGQTPNDFQYGATEENMDVTGQADEAAMQPATGEEVDVESLRQELGPGEILVRDPETGKHFAAHESQLDDLINEGYERVD